MDVGLRRVKSLFGRTAYPSLGLPAVWSGAMRRKEASESMFMTPKDIRLIRLILAEVTLSSSQTSRRIDERLVDGLAFF